MACKYRKFVWLVDLIYTKGRITFEQIQEKWANSVLNDNKSRSFHRRTFINWREEIESLFGLIIECDRSTNQYYIKNADDITHNKTQQWLLNTLAVTNIINESHDLKDKILLEDMPSDARYLAPLMEAIRGENLVRMAYQRFDAPEMHDMTFKPYCVKAFKQRWYTAGESSDHPNEVRVYALDRIHDIEILDVKYKIPENFDGQTFFGQYYGVWIGDKKPMRIIIRASKRSADYIRSLPLHHSQKETERNSEYSIFEFFVAPTYDFIQEIRTHGGDVEVLEPQEVIDNFIDLTEKYRQLYHKKSKK